MFTDEQKKIINAYINGKEIQQRVKGLQEWNAKKQAHSGTFVFDFHVYEYRIKPTEQYVVVLVYKYKSNFVTAQTWTFSEEHRARNFVEQKSLDPQVVKHLIIPVECNQ